MATFKQIQAIKNISENVRKAGYSLGDAMRDAGYSQTTSEAPQRLTESKAFKEIMGNAIRKEKITERLDMLLDSARHAQHQFPLGMDKEKIRNIIESVPGCKLVDVQQTMKCQVVFFTAPNDKSRHDAIDTFLKVNGDYAAQKVKIERPLEDLSDEELVAQEKELEEKLAIRRRLKNG